MDFVSIRIVTSDIQRLVEFYEAATGIAAAWNSEDFAELATASCTLAIVSERAMAMLNPGAARGADNRSVIVEFRVGDVDAAFRRLAHDANGIGEVVQEPTTMPWGNRSLLFRDPDGNLVNFFAPVSAAAIARYAGGK